MAKPRPKLEASQHRPLIASYYLKGLTQGEIAELLGISIATVNRDLKLIQEQWRQSAIHDLDIVRQRELEKIDVVELEAWEAWQRSQADAVTTNEFDGRKSTSRKNQYGDSKYLAIIKDCVELRAKILGISAPVKQDVQGTLDIRVIREETKE